MMGSAEKLLKLDSEFWKSEESFKEESQVFAFKGPQNEWFAQVPTGSPSFAGLPRNKVANEAQSCQFKETSTSVEIGKGCCISWRAFPFQLVYKRALLHGKENFVTL